MRRFSYSIAYEEYYKKEKLEREYYKANGMSDRDTEVMIELTKKQFKADCVYNYHNIAMSTYRTEFIDDGRNSFKKIRKGSPKIKEKVNINWIETIKSEELQNYISDLSIEEKIILTEIAINSTPKAVVADALGITRQTVAKKYNKIINDLKEYIKKIEL